MGVYDVNGHRIDEYIGLINVQEYGALADGVHSDSLIIQEALDSKKNTGGIFFFPKGTYLLNTHLIFYSNQWLIFEEGATLLQGAAINNLLMTYCTSSIEGYNGTHDCLIYGATFDGGSYTENNTLVGTVHAKNITFENCKFKNAYGTWHDLEINSSYNVRVINCEFEGSRKTDSAGELIQIDAYGGSGGTWPWNNGANDGTISKYIEIAGCIFNDCTVAPAIGNHSSYTTLDYLKIHDNIFDGLTSSRGSINLSYATNIDVYNNIFNGCTKGIGGTSSADYYVYGNRFVDVTTAISGGVAHNNMINGTYTA